jgi:GntR family transcriptional regulator, transcriptional repressor for pyruvate dehydrogenase complex
MSDASVFRSVSAGRASQDVLRQIKLAIRTGALRPGDRLPSERELTDRLGVSRVTVRDALRMLEAAGLIEIRVGARGGAFVTAPNADRVGGGLTHMLMMSAHSDEDITEVRQILELGTIPLVVARAESRDLAELEEIVERSEAALQAGTYGVALSAEFHTRLARAAHNRAITLLVDAFRDPLLATLEHAKAVAPQMGDPGVAEHRAIVKAVRERNLRVARQVMRAHLGRTAARLRTGQAAAGTGAA